MLHILMESCSDKIFSEMDTERTVFLGWPAVSLGDAQGAGSLLQLTAHTSTSTVLLGFLLSAAWATASDGTKWNKMAEIHVLYRALPFATVQKSSVSLVFQYLIAALLLTSECNSEQVIFFLNIRIHQTDRIYQSFKKPNAIKLQQQDCV